MTACFDIVLIAHNSAVWNLAESVVSSLNEVETIGFNPILIDNRVNNRGFAKAANLGAAQGSAKIIGFLNPDLEIHDSILSPVLDHFCDNPQDVICGERFNKPDRELQIWGCKDWVCGAAFFARRSFFDSMFGFDEAYVWSWEETDLIRRAQKAGHGVRSISLPVSHRQRPDTPHDSHYKNVHFDKGAKIFNSRWRDR